MRPGRSRTAAGSSAGCGRRRRRSTAAAPRSSGTSSPRGSSDYPGDGRRMAVAPHNMVDYEETIRTFKLDVPERFNFARQVIGHWAKDPEKLGMWSPASGG